jgi:hypothetical protein
LLLLEELAESGFLIVAALEDDSDVSGGLGSGDGAAIEFSACEAMDVAAERGAIGFVDGLCDAGGDARRLRSLRDIALRAGRLR